MPLNYPTVISILGSGTTLLPTIIPTDKLKRSIYNAEKSIYNAKKNIFNPERGVVGQLTHV
jgi:hypothetical protein